MSRVRNYLTLIKTRQTIAISATLALLVALVALIAVPAFSPGLKPTATTATSATLGVSTTPTPTPTTVASPSPSAAPLRPASLVVVSPAVTSTATTPPSPSPSTPDTAIETWVNQYGAYFTTISNQSVQFRSDENGASRTTIALDCHNLAETALTGLGQPAVPEVTLNDALILALNGIKQGGQSCADGINFNDSNEAAIGMNQLGAALQGFATVQARIVPSP